MGIQVVVGRKPLAHGLCCILKADLSVGHWHAICGFQPIVEAACVSICRAHDWWPAVIKSRAHVIGILAPIILSRGDVCWHCAVLPCHS